MARLPRLVLPGALQHVLQRGNNRQPVFMDDTDRRHYLDALREATRLHEVRVHGYVLMPDHVHLLVTPQTSTGLARAMQTLGRRYVVAFNRRHGRTGTLWEGRYRTTLVEAPAYFHRVLCYVEQHPLRHMQGAAPAEHAWSSAAHHLGLRRDSLISEHAAYWALGNTPFEREAAHRAALAQAIGPDELARLRRHVHSGWPLLTDAGHRDLAAQAQRPLKPRAAGRPLKSDDSVPQKKRVVTE